MSRLFKFFGSRGCVLKDIRNSSGFGHMISPGGEAESQVEWSYVDDSGNPTYVAEFVPGDIDDAPEYRCAKCGDEFGCWDDVVEHVSDSNDDS